MEDKKIPKRIRGGYRDEDVLNMRSVLQDAIRMQALFSGRKIKIVETSTRTN
jgi:hypothetical protein